MRDLGRNFQNAPRRDGRSFKDVVSGNDFLPLRPFQCNPLKRMRLFNGKRLVKKEAECLEVWFDFDQRKEDMIWVFCSVVGKLRKNFQLNEI